MKTIELIQKVLEKQYKSFVFEAEVVSVQEEQRTCTVQVDGELELDDVRLTAVIDSLQTPCYFVPKIGSVVICTALAGDLSRLVVIQHSEVGKIVLRNGNNGGVIVWGELQKELKALQSRVTAIENGIANAVPAPTDGGIAFKAGILATINANPQLPNFDSPAIENKKTLH